MQTQAAQRSLVPRRRVLLILLVALTLLAFAALGVGSYVQSEPTASQAEPATTLVVNRPSDRPYGIVDGSRSEPCVPENVPEHVPTDRLRANLGYDSAAGGC